MKKAVKQKVRMLGALEADRQMKRKLESSNYSLTQNFEYFKQLINLPQKHYMDMEHLKKFMLQIPYLLEITQGMSVRLIEKILKQLQIRFYSAGSQNNSEFQILLTGEIQVGQRSFVQTDTIHMIGQVIRDAWTLVLNNNAYEELLSQYHEHLLEQKLTLIRQYSVFNKISIQRLKNQLDQFKQEHAKTNQIIYTCGIKADSFYLIQNGEIKLIQNDVQLQLIGQKGVFGEMELVKGQDLRQHTAIVTQSITYFKIGYFQLRVLLNNSGMYEQFCQAYNVKEQFFQYRLQECYKQPTEIIDYSEFKHQIIKQYHNYIPASKIRRSQTKSTPNLDQELKEAKEDKLIEAFKQFNNQIKQNFKSNHLLRKVLIQAKQTNHNIPIMNGLNLDRYIPKNNFNNKKQLKILSQFNESSYQHFLSDADTVSTTTFVKGVRLLSSTSKNNRLQSAIPKFYTSSSKLTRPMTGI